jgi:hypothetical protein
LSVHFPTVIWVWRIVTSPRARRIWFCLVVALIFFTIALRIYDGIFEYRILATVNGLAQIRLDQTSKVELLKAVAGMRSGPPSWAKCHGEECFSEEISNWPTGHTSLFFFRVYVWSKYAYKFGYWMGLRLWHFPADAELRDGKVHKIRYHLDVDDGTALYPGSMFVNVESLRGFSSFNDDSPDYRVSDYFKWPELQINVDFTPHAPVQLVHHAFDLNLNCIWQLLGCRSAKELLPLAWQDRLPIQAAFQARLQSPEPCPDHILTGRARDSSDILLVEVARERPDLTARAPWERRLVDFRLLEVLKGQINRPLEGVGTIPTIFLSPPDNNIPNPALRLLHPGLKVLMFSDSSTDIDSPCEIVAATPSALQTIKAALASPTSHVAEDDRLPY